MNTAKALRFDLPSGEAHFRGVHGPIARGEMDPSVAHLGLYAKFGLGYTAVLSRLERSDATINQAHADYFTAHGGLSISEVHQAYIRGDHELIRSRIDKKEVDRAQRILTRNFPHNRNWKAKKAEYERVMELIAEPWPVSIRPESYVAPKTHTASPRPKTDRVSKSVAPPTEKRIDYQEAARAALESDRHFDRDGKFILMALAAGKEPEQIASSLKRDLRAVTSKADYLLDE